jgi:hypothetical protein
MFAVLWVSFECFCILNDASGLCCKASHRLKTFMMHVPPASTRCGPPIHKHNLYTYIYIYTYLSLSHSVVPFFVCHFLLFSFWTAMNMMGRGRAPFIVRDANVASHQALIDDRWLRVWSRMLLRMGLVRHRSLCPAVMGSGLSKGTEDWLNKCESGRIAFP